MISAIRNKFGSRLLDFFIWLSLIVFVGLYLIPSGKNGQKSAEWALSVNDEILPYSEYMQILESQRKNGKNDLNKKDIIEALTNKLLMQSLINKMNIVIKQESVNAKLQKILPGLVNSDGVIDAEQLKIQLSQSGLDQTGMQELVENVIQQVKDELQAEVLNSALIGSLYIPNFVLNNYYNAEYAQKQFVILTAPYKKYQDQLNKHKVDDSDLRTFFDQQNIATKRYWTKETRSCEVYTFTPVNFGMQVTDKQIKAYYDRNRKTEFVKQAAQVQVRRILLDSQDQAGQIRADLANDAGQFEALAKKHSLDKQSAVKGGLLDFFGENERESALSEAAFELRADGEISEVIQTKEGFEIIQRVAKKAVEFRPLAEVKNLIEQKVLAQQFEKLFPINARRIIAQAATQPEAFGEFIKDKKAVKKTISHALASPQDRIITKLFELKKPEQKVFITDSNKGEIIVLKTVVPAQVQDFEKIKETVLQDYKKAKTIELIKKQLDQANLELKAGKNPKNIAQEFGLEYELTPLAVRSDANKLKKELPLELLWSLRMPGGTKIEVDAHVAHPNGYLVKLERIEQPTPTELLAKKSSAKMQLFSAYREGLDRSFVAYLRKNGTIKLNTAIINV